MNSLLRHRLASFLIALSTLFIAHASAQEQEPTQEKQSFIVGVATHLLNRSAPPTLEMRLIHDAGITSLRDDAYWSSVEVSPGQLQIPSVWRTYLEDTDAEQLNKMLILGGINQIHDNAKPVTQPMENAFLAYVDYVTQRLRNQVGFYEIWNEWDLDNPKDPNVSFAYIKVIIEAAQHIRTRDTKVKILAGAVTTKGIEEGFADRLIEGKAMDHLDGLSLHPYVHCGLMTPERWITWLRQVDRQLSDKAGKQVALYLTEMGWPSHEGRCGVSEETQAAYLARSYFLVRTLPNVKGMWWYDLLNDGTDREEQEHNFGLLRPDLRAKPAYQVLSAIAPILRNYRYDARNSLQSDDQFLLSFSKGQERYVVAWSVGRPRQQVITSGIQSGNLQMLDTAEPTKGLYSSGEKWVCTGDQCSAPVLLTHFPKIISLGVNSTVSER